MDEKSFEKRVWEFLGSRDFSVFIFIMGLTYTLFLAVFGMVVPVPWVSNISKLLPFKVLYLLFFVNLIICEIKWIPVVIRRCRKLRFPVVPQDLERFRHKIEIRGSKFDLSGLERHLKWRGYKVCEPEIEEHGLKYDFCSPPPVLSLLFAHRGRFSPIGNIVFHISFLFLLTGVLVSLFFRFEGSARVTEGYPFSGSIAEYTAVSASPLAPLPNVSFSLEKISSKFWEGRQLFTDLRADMAYKEGRGSAWLSSPLNISGARVTVSSIGITPMYILKNKEGKELDAGFVNLAVFVPGTEDHFQIPGFPHQIFVSFYPDYEINDGKVINRSMELNNPAYFLKIFRGRLLVYSGLIRPKEELAFESLRLSFPEMRYWGQFRIIKDPGFLFVWIAFIFFTIGLAWRLLFYRREVVVVREGDTAFLYGNSDYYFGLFENRLRFLVRIIGEG